MECQLYYVKRYGCLDTLALQATRQPFIWLLRTSVVTPRLDALASSLEQGLWTLVRLGERYHAGA